MNWPAGYGRRVLAEVDSTNAEAARVAPALAGPEWILGLRQTSGRGRRGRVWAMPEGNFAATLVMRPQEPPAVVALRSFVASLALRDAVAQVAGPGGLALKWPNDVLLNGGKLAGILLESLGGPGGHLAIGIGVNLARVPDLSQLEPGAVAPVSIRGETGAEVTPEAFLDCLAAAYARREEQFVTFGFAPVRAAWLASAARIGEEITARMPRETVTGTFETVDEAGNLVLKTGRARVTIAAAEIFF